MSSNSVFIWFLDVTKTDYKNC